MSYVTKRLSVCPNHNCRNFIGNKISPPSKLKYRPLLEFSCVKCNEKWLVCFQNEKRFCRRRYHRAYNHIQSYSRESLHLSNSEEFLSFSNNDDTNEDICSIEDIQMPYGNIVLPSTDISEFIYPQFNASFDYFSIGSSKRFFQVQNRISPIKFVKI